MKNTAMTLTGVIIAVIGLHAFKAYQTSDVTGRMPIDPKGSRVIARQGNDSVQTDLSPDGSFRISLTKGVWQLDVEKQTNQMQVKKIFTDSMVIRGPGNIDLGVIMPDL
jgi:hypothetical protein